MGLWIAVVLAVVQGLTEFFPVSSSGHLVILEALFKMRQGVGGEGLLFEVAVHVGTLCAVLIFYRRKAALLGRALFAALLPRKGTVERYADELRYIGLVIFGTLPVAILGFLLVDEVEAAFESPSLTALLFVATGVYLLLTKRSVHRRHLGWGQAFIIGLAQAIAILPGCSRSGWTIATGLLLGIGFAEAAEFSFMLSIPAVVGALILHLVKDPVALEAAPFAPLLIGAAVAFLTGLVALKLLIQILNGGAFHRFAYYLLQVGIAAFIYFLR